MKKIQSLLLSVVLLSSTGANAFFCGYKDYFRINKENSPDLFIVRAQTDGDLNVEVLSPISFEIKDGGSCNTGFTHVVVANKEFSWCALDIKDGPYMFHPSINASCSELKFKGPTYEGFNSYTYTLNFE